MELQSFIYHSFKNFKSWTFHPWRSLHLISHRQVMTLSHHRVADLLCFELFSSHHLLVERLLKECFFLVHLKVFVLSPWAWMSSANNKPYLSSPKVEHLGVFINLCEDQEVVMRLLKRVVIHYIEPHSRSPTGIFIKSSSTTSTPVIAKKNWEALKKSSHQALDLTIGFKGMSSSSLHQFSQAYDCQEAMDMPLKWEQSPCIRHRSKLEERS